MKTADRDWRWQDLTAIIIAYVSDLRYLRVLTAGAPRVGLDGSPVGIVTDHHASHARKLIAARIAAKLKAGPGSTTIIRPRQALPPPPRPKPALRGTSNA